MFSVFSNLLMFTGPLFMLQVYDRVLASRSEETLVAIFGLVAILYTFYGLIEYARKQVVMRVGVRLQDSLKAQILKLTIDKSARGKGDNRGSLQDVDAVGALFNSPAILALFDIPWTPLFLIAMFVFHPILGWMGVFGIIILISVAVINQILTAQKIRKGSEQTLAANRFAQRSEACSEYIVAQGMRQSMVDRWSALKNNAVEQTLYANDWQGSFSSFTKAFRLFLQSAILAAGAWLVLQEQLSPGAIIAATILLGRALTPIDVGISQWQVVQRAFQSWHVIKGCLNQADDEETITALPPPAPDLLCKSVTLILKPGDEPILSQVSFHVPPGHVLGVIGRSGSGKTMLSRVVTGILPPTAGEVRLGGATLDQYGSERVGKFIGYLPQEVQFFDGTIAENIAQMDVVPDNSKVILAAKKALVHDLILRLPKGYDTSLNGASFALSGGQKQRLGLARALYQDPKLLVLDEPNSALDADGSEALNQAIKEMKSDGRSVLIMTHRQAALSACDTLLVLDHGRVVSFGPRDEIIRSMIKPATEVNRRVQGGHR